ncbi:MAG: efflux RND transporter permease subunit [Bacteroidaceae bacterium]|nr:efflux RND transporter permease subunit [Bacteroidaceae bacterium]
MKASKGIIEWTMRYYQITLLMIFLSVVLGIFGLGDMSKQEFPEFTVRQGLVVGVYPGATSEEAEEQLAKPLERYLFTFKEVKREDTYSISKNGMVIVMVELNDNVNNKDEVWSKIKLGLQTFKMSLPSGVLALIAKDDFGDTSALLVTLESKDKTYRELKTYLETLEDRLLTIPSVSNLRSYGLQNEEISIFLDKDKLALYNIDYRTLMTTLFAQYYSTSGGIVESADVNAPIHISTVFASEKEVGSQIVLSDKQGNVVRLRDVAKIVRRYPSPTSYITNNGVKSILLSMEMQQGNNIVQYGEEVEKVLKTFEAELPSSVSIQRIADQPKVVGESVSSFLTDLFVSILVVILVLMVLFPFKSAIVAATSIPISIFISLGMMYIIGIPLNTVTLAALIVVLGMIVDNSIIVIDGYLERLDNGMSRWHAAISSAKDYFMSIFLATLCICIIFFPLLATLSGMFLDFLQFFPWTITISLMTSLLIAMIFIPLLEYAIIKKGLHAKKTKEIKEDKKESFNMLNWVQSNYEKALGWVFKFPCITMGIGVLSVVIAILLFMDIPIRMMPIADRDQFAVEIYLPQGAPLHQTELVADSLEHMLKKDERVVSVTSFMGTSSPRFQTSYAPYISAGKNYAQFIVNTTSISSTTSFLDDYTNFYANYFPNAYVKLKQLDYSRTSIPIEIRFKGDNLAHLQLAADQLMKKMRALPSINWIHTNFLEKAPGVAVDLNTTEIARLGLSRSMVESELALHYGGVSLGSVWEGDYALPITLRSIKKEQKDHLSDVKDVYISAMIPGVSVPLRQIATVQPEWKASQVIRRNGVRCISVLAQPKRGVNDNAAFKEVIALMDSDFKAALPEDVTYEIGGSVESDSRLIPQIVSGLIISIVIVFFFLLIHYKKIGLAIAALTSLSLCLFGAALGLWALNVSFGLTCILGIISLIGIIVRNIILIFDHAQDLRINAHISAKEAAMDAGKRRMLPIFLTSATTAVGVVPMILSDSSLWTPMGIVIFFGTFFSTIFVVTIVPVFYWKIFGNK